MLHVFKSISTVYVVQLAVGVITSSHAHILYVFMCFACHILNVFKKYEKCKIDEDENVQKSTHAQYLSKSTSFFSQGFFTFSLPDYSMFAVELNYTYTCTFCVSAAYICVL